ncbi:MAG: TraR/DksA C4-type zinc finger protein [Cyanobacteria bacterium]|nr:TraR/DksA C4-type zinc finger protein [Cyanobacteriota bacterium]
MQCRYPGRYRAGASPDDLGDAGQSQRSAPQAGRDCFECGEEIAEARLRALPFAVRCKDCEEALETVGQQRLPGAARRPVGAPLGRVQLTHLTARHVCVGEIRVRSTAGRGVGIVPPVGASRPR